MSFFSLHLWPIFAEPLCICSVHRVLVWCSPCASAVFTGSSCAAAPVHLQRAQGPRLLQPLCICSVHRVLVCFSRSTIHSVLFHKRWAGNWECICWHLKIINYIKPQAYLSRLSYVYNMHTKTNLEFEKIYDVNATLCYQHWIDGM